LKNVAAVRYNALIKHWLWYFVLPVVLLALWEGAAQAGLIHDYTMPSPEKVMKTAIELLADGTLVGNMFISVVRVIEGFLIAFIVALIIGIATGLFPKFETVTDFTLQILKPIPPIAWIPLAILWFGIEETSKIYIIFIGAFFPIFLNTVDGIKNIDKKYIELAKAYEVSKWKVIRQIVLPGALPFIMTGVRVGLGSAWICVVAAEMIAATRGVGYMLMDGRSLARPDMVILGMLIIGIIGKLMDDGLKKISKRIIRWN
jgi:sulfonate transport system permease protein